MELEVLGDLPRYTISQFFPIKILSTMSGAIVR